MAVALSSAATFCGLVLITLRRRFVGLIVAVASGGLALLLLLAPACLG